MERSVINTQNNHPALYPLLIFIAVCISSFFSISPPCSEAATVDISREIDVSRGSLPLPPLEKGKHHRHNPKGDGESCDLFQGSWVVDDTGNHPLYSNGSTSCPLINQEFDCQKNGRPDQAYLKYRWQPRGCDLPRFDGQDFLTRFKGKKIMFVGDFLSSNQYESLKCMLYSSAQLHQSQPLKYNLKQTGLHSVLTLQDYNMTIELNHSPFLVDVVKEEQGRILKLESVENNSKAWIGMDVLIFNSWHWWAHRGKLQVWDYIQKGDELYKDMDRIEAYRVALNTWANWLVDSNINPQITRVFFQGVSPTHLNGKEWGQPKTTCLGQTEPFMGTEYPVGPPPPLEVVKEVLGNMTTIKVGLLDITQLSQMRKDGHPSHYGIDGEKGNDCSHWCLAGVPDTWNELLYALLLPSNSSTPHDHRRHG